MSTSPESEQPSSKSSPESELDLDLHFLPSWAQQPQDLKKYDRYRGDEGERGGRGERRGGGFGGGGGGFGGRGPRPGGGGGRPPGSGGPQGQRGGGGGFQQRGPRPAGAPGGGFGGGDRGPRRGGPGRGGPMGRRDDREPREAPAPLPEIDVLVIPEEKGVESLARQIKLTGRAYPLFEIASLILKKSERFRVELRTIKRGENVAQPIYVCSLDETIWLSEQDAAAHILDKHFATFYQSEKIAGDAPKGTYTFVGQCGISGVILGPPNYHDYQTKLRRLHSERFGNMPFDVYKSRIKIVRDEETVKKWMEEQSWKTQYITLNVPEAQTLTTREAVDEHFRQTHLANVIRKEDVVSLPGPVALNQANQQLRRLINVRVEEQRRFPLKVVTTLSEQFQKQGLQFFKAHKNVTHVSVARPRHLDTAATPVSEGIKKIVDFIESKQNTTRKQLIEYFAPGVQLKAEGQSAEAAAAQPPSPEVEQVVSDLHWLIHQGHVIEFSNGSMQLARKPVPKPPRQEPKKKANAGGAESTQVVEATSTVEGPTGTEAVESGVATSVVAEPASQSVIEQAAGAPVEPAASAPSDEAQAAEDPAAIQKSDNKPSV